MYRSKYFEYMNVYNNEGKYIGFIKDIALNYHKAMVIGFKISSNSLFSKDKYILTKDIIAINEKVIVKDFIKGDYLCFKDIKSMDIIDEYGSIIGVVEDFIMDIKDYSIKGIIVNPGIINRILKGKEIILTKETILGNESISYCGHRSKTKLISLAYNGLGDEVSEKDLG